MSASNPRTFPAWRARRSRRRALAAAPIARTARLALGLLLALAAGCATPRSAIFVPSAQPLVWPGGDEPPRIRYLGQIATEADLKAGVSFRHRLGAVLFGRKPPRGLVLPYAVCTDGGDRLFVADSGDQAVHVFDLAARTYAQWRPATASQRFGLPVGIACAPSAERLFVADSAANLVYVFDLQGRALGEIGRGLFARPTGLALARQPERLYVADTLAHQVVCLALDGRELARLGQRGSAPGQFNFPTNVAVDSQGRLYVSDSLNFRVQQFSPDLQFLRQIGVKGDMPGCFGQPKGIAVDPQDHLYVVDSNFEAVQVFDDNGALLLSFGQEGRGPGQFWLPAGLCIDGRNQIWVADSYNRRVQVFTHLPERRP